MYEQAYKAYTNLNIPEPKEEKTDSSKGLLTRNNPVMPTESSDERSRIGRYVSQIRTKREALKNNG